ncbi:hypothetical protein P7K49_036667 [Saguinus oedipus]|uniref:Uncharacterized protein n=1 Tax=Saguinus oedipus TaxID=9490 RepID=A0ABQ9TKS7_SAGOE|nr:hypothetical protein P7K49_036667 [Saguinus oedipus]
MLTRFSNGSLALNIRNPWHSCWDAGGSSKVYEDYTWSHPQGTWLIFQSYTRIVSEATEQLSSQPPLSCSSPQVRVQSVTITYGTRHHLNGYPLVPSTPRNFSLCYETASSSSPSCNTTVKIDLSVITSRCRAPCPSAEQLGMTTGQVPLLPGPALPSQKGHVVRVEREYFQKHLTTNHSS